MLQWCGSQSRKSRFFAMGRLSEADWADRSIPASVPTPKDSTPEFLFDEECLNIECSLGIAARVWCGRCYPGLPTSRLFSSERGLLRANRNNFIIALPLVQFIFTLPKFEATSCAEKAVCCSSRGCLSN